MSKTRKRTSVTNESGVRLLGRAQSASIPDINLGGYFKLIGNMMVPSSGHPEADEIRGMDCAVTVRRSDLSDALAHARESGDDSARELSVALEQGALDSDELLIANWPSAHGQRERMNDLVESLMPDEIPQPVELLQARRAAVMRRDMLAIYGYYSAEELAEQHGSRAKNRYALAARWSREGRVFGVPLGARTVFPAFQFDADCNPYPVVRDVLAAMPRADMSPWGVALWWYANNAWLPGETRPAELIGGPEQELLIEAARKLSEPEPL